jgi:hypothetical protein
MAQSKNKRNIVVYYFTDAARTAVVAGTTRWYKYARRAKDSAHDAMVLDLYGAAVAVVYDDENGKDLYHFVRTGANKVETVWNSETMKHKYMGISRDPKGDFTRKLARSAEKRKARQFLGLPRRNYKN